MDNPYKTQFDINTGTISVCGADKFQILVDEVPSLLESLNNEYERAKAIMGNPLLDTRGIDEAILHYKCIVNDGGKAPSIKALLEFYQNTLVMLRELESVIYCTVDSLSSIKMSPTNMLDIGKVKAEINRLREWRDKIAAILEAHKQHMEE